MNGILSFSAEIRTPVSNKSLVIRNVCPEPLCCRISSYSAGIFVNTCRRKNSGIPRGLFNNGSSLMNRADSGALSTAQKWIPAFSAASSQRQWLIRVTWCPRFLNLPPIRRNGSMSPAEPSEVQMMCAKTYSGSRSGLGGLDEARMRLTSSSDKESRCCNTRSS